MFVICVFVFFKNFFMKKIFILFNIIKYLKRSVCVILMKLFIVLVFLK